MPTCVSDAIVQPIPKGGNKDYSLSGNYRGIALASCLSKVIELCILELCGQHLQSSQLQFGFKPGTICTGFSISMGGFSSVWLFDWCLESIWHCWSQHSIWKTTNQRTALSSPTLPLWLVPIPTLAYKAEWLPIWVFQSFSWCTAKWHSFTNLVYSLSRWSAHRARPHQCRLLRGWHVCWCSCVCGWHYIIGSHPFCSQETSAVCTSIGTNLMLKFNPDKTQCIRFSQKSSGVCSSVFMFCGKYIECVRVFYTSAMF